MSVGWNEGARQTNLVRHWRKLEAEAEAQTALLRELVELYRASSGTLSGTPFEVDESLIGTEYGPSKRE